MEHTEKEKKVIKEYEESVDPEVLNFVKAVMDDSERLNYVTVAFLSDSAAGEIERITGKKVYGNRVVLDVNGIKHIEKRHGENGQQDHSMSNEEDIARMGYVITHYDDIMLVDDTTTGYLDENGLASPMVKICKRIDGTYYVIEAVNSSTKKKNYVVSAYISKN